LAPSFARFYLDCDGISIGEHVIGIIQVRPCRGMAYKDGHNMVYYRRVGSTNKLCSNIEAEQLENELPSYIPYDSNSIVESPLYSAGMSIAIDTTLLQRAINDSKSNGLAAANFADLFMIATSQGVIPRLGLSFAFGEGIVSILVPNTIVRVAKDDCTKEAQVSLVCIANITYIYDR
jgi:hypothetical protein